MSITTHVTGRKRAGQRPLQPTQLERAGLLTGTVATVVEGDYAAWRATMYAALRCEAGQEWDHPRDGHLKHRYSVDTRLLIVLAGRIHMVRVDQRFEMGSRLRYRVAWPNDRWIALTQAQLYKLMDHTVAALLRTHSCFGAPPPPTGIGTTTASGALPPLKWFGFHPALARETK
jgi:hypothetical protein